MKHTHEHAPHDHPHQDESSREPLHGGDPDSYGHERGPFFFSVIISTYERPRHLRRCLEALARQSFPNFEVIVVDQSASPEALPSALFAQLRLRVLFSKQRGAASGRNRALEHATGLYVACTDDDCIPEPTWLQRAAERFEQTPCVGLEGRVCSEHLGDPRYRTVSNVGIEGVAFMTANLILRRDVVDKVGRFDERFTVFREDTELAWRVMQFGKIPYASDVVVFHPAHSAAVERESPGERVKMFAYDGLLFAKHPRRYLQLLIREAHYRNAAGFWTHFVRGLNEFKVQVSLKPLLEHLRHLDPQWWAAIAFEPRTRPNGMTEQDMASLCSLL